MARRYPSRLSDKNSGTLIIEPNHPHGVEVSYLPYAYKIETARRNQLNVGNIPINMLYINNQDQSVIIYPINTNPNNRDFLKPKYKKIKCITLNNVSSG